MRVASAERPDSVTVPSGAGPAALAAFRHQTAASRPSF
jgi:hypothetical protein